MVWLIEKQLKYTAYSFSLFYFLSTQGHVKPTKSVELEHKFSCQITIVLALSCESYRTFAWASHLPALQPVFEQKR